MVIDIVIATVIVKEMIYSSGELKIFSSGSNLYQGREEEYEVMVYGYRYDDGEGLADSDSYNYGYDFSYKLCYCYYHHYYYCLYCLPVSLLLLLSRPFFSIP